MVAAVVVAAVVDPMKEDGIIMNVKYTKSLKSFFTNTCCCRSSGRGTTGGCGTAGGRGTACSCGTSWSCGA